jgi:hypothetical protein
VYGLHALQLDSAIMMIMIDRPGSIDHHQLLTWNQHMIMMSDELQSGHCQHRF